MDKAKIAKELVAVAKELTAETKGTITSGYVRENGGSMYLRKSFGTLPAKKVASIGNKMVKVLSQDIDDTLAELDEMAAEVEVKEAMVSGWQRGGLFEVWFSVEGLSGKIWDFQKDLARKGYRLK